MRHHAGGRFGRQAEVAEQRRALRRLGQLQQLLQRVALASLRPSLAAKERRKRKPHRRLSRRGGSGGGLSGRRLGGLRARSGSLDEKMKHLRILVQPQRLAPVALVA